MLVGSVARPAGESQRAPRGALWYSSLACRKALAVTLAGLGDLQVPQDEGRGSRGGPGRGSRAHPGVDVDLAGERQGRALPVEVAAGLARLVHRDREGRRGGRALQRDVLALLAGRRGRGRSGLGMIVAFPLATVVGK